MTLTGRPILNTCLLIHKLKICSYGVYLSDKMAHQPRDPEGIRSYKKIIWFMRWKQKWG